MKIALVSGGFDPIHIGHIRMFQEASEKGVLVVGLNSDEWLMRKKGYIFMPFGERKEIIEAIRGVEFVSGFDDRDDTCLDFLRRYINHPMPIIFCNGGDRKLGTTPEVDFCKLNGIELAWGVGGDYKIQSSSSLVNVANIQRG